MPRDIDPLVFWAFILQAIICVAGWIYISTWRENRKRKALHLIADQLGLIYIPKRDSQLGQQYAFLDKLSHGSDRYASHILTGKLQDQNILVFEYHYVTRTGKSKSHNYLSAYLISLPRELPETTIAPEDFLSKFAQSIGYDDIDFESAEFSHLYCVRSRDKRIAYDICHPRMIQFFLDHPFTNIEIKRAVLAIFVEGPLDPERVTPTLERLLKARRLLPEHLWEN